MYKGLSALWGKRKKKRNCNVLVLESSFATRFHNMRLHVCTTALHFIKHSVVKKQTTKLATTTFHKNTLPST